MSLEYSRVNFTSLLLLSELNGSSTVKSRRIGLETARVDLPLSENNETMGHVGVNFLNTLGRIQQLKAGWMPLLNTTTVRFKDCFNAWNIPTAIFLRSTHTYFADKVEMVTLKEERCCLERPVARTLRAKRLDAVLLYFESDLNLSFLLSSIDSQIRVKSEAIAGDS